MERAKTIFKIFTKNSKISPFTLIIKAARDWSTNKNIKSKKSAICNEYNFLQNTGRKSFQWGERREDRFVKFFKASLKW